MPEDVFRIVGTLQAGAYRVDAVVAEGGFAVVYGAYHEAFRARVALKCLKIPGTLSPAHQAEFLERFRSEAELLFRLSASLPAVVRPLHVGVLDTPTGTFAPFIALEWLEGVTLDQRIAERRRSGQPPLSLDAALRLLTPVARALERAHHFPGPSGEIAVLHRDLKPENVFVARVHGEETTKILDFGIGTVKSAATQIVGKQSASEQSFSAFTPAYGAPEQWVPKRFGQTGRWTDVWGLALTLVETVLGRCPIDGDHAAMMGSAIDEKRRPTPRAEGLEVTDAVEHVFSRALAVDPLERYQEVADFWADLHRALGMTVSLVPARPPPEVPVSPQFVAAIGVAPSLPPDPNAGTQPMVRAAVPRIPTLIVPGGASSPMAEAARAAQAAVVNATPQDPPSSMPAATDPRAGSSPRSAPGSSPRAAPPSSPRSAPARADAPPSYMLGSTIDDFDDFDDPSMPVARIETARRSFSGEELDGVGLSPVASRPVARAPRAGVEDVRFERSSGAVARRFGGPVKLVAVGVVVMLADFVYAFVVGEPLRLGPLRPVMLAGPLVLVGVAMGTARLFGSDS